ncbi:DUF3093 domain-containing protein [Nocardioides pacificus]
MEYAERLTVPLRWWVQGTMLVASMWLAVVVAMPAVAAWSVTGVMVLLLVLSLTSYGAARVSVSDGVLRAGSAHIEVHLLGPVEALDAEATRLVAGRDADVRAHLVLRPYLKRSVRVTIADPADPTPYWLISTRRPQELTAALATARDAARASHGD